MSRVIAARLLVPVYRWVVRSIVLQGFLRRQMKHLHDYYRGDLSMAEMICSEASRVRLLKNLASWGNL